MKLAVGIKKDTVWEVSAMVSSGMNMCAHRLSVKKAWHRNEASIKEVKSYESASCQRQSFRLRPERNDTISCVWDE